MPQSYLWLPIFARRQSSATFFLPFTVFLLPFSLFSTTAALKRLALNELPKPKGQVRKCMSVVAGKQEKRKRGKN